MTQLNVVSDNAQPQPRFQPNPDADGGRAALVYLPWGAIARASIAMGILKQCGRRAGWDVDVHHFNLRFAERIGFERYDQISRTSELGAEWFFATHVYEDADSPGAGGDWDGLHASDQGRGLAEELADLTGGPDACRQLVQQEIPAFVEECVESVDWGSYDAFGFSVTFAQTGAALMLSKRLKEEYPDTPVIFGGANVDGEMGFEILKSAEWIDYVVHGEAEHSFPTLLAEIHHLQAEDERTCTVPGVSWRRDDGELVAGWETGMPVPDLNESPIPDYGEYYREVRRLGLDRELQIKLPFESSRGCWWGAKKHCTFCGLNRDGMAFRQKDPERVYEEVLKLSREYRCVDLFAVDNILDMRYFRSLLPKLAEEDLDFSIFYEVKANLRREQLQALAAAGVDVIQPGIESFNTEVLDLMGKGVKAIQNVQLLKWAMEEGIEVAWNILYGFPGETPEQYADLADTLLTLSHVQPPGGMGQIVYERFSPYHFNADDYGLDLEANPRYELIYPDEVIDHDRMAYYFVGELQEPQPNPEEYIADARRVVESWRQWWSEPSHRPVLFYEKGPGFITLYDSRPLPGAGGGTRRVVLNELQSLIYLFCDENHTLSKIHSMVQQEMPDLEVSEERLEALLDRFVEARLMYREGDRYLSLATRGAPEVQSGVKPQTVEAA